MKTIKIKFCSWHFKDCATFLDSILKMTPGKSGKWKNIEATLSENDDNVDFYVIMDGYRGTFNPKKALFFGQHPKGGSPSFKDYKDTECFKAFPLDKHMNPGEWWIPHTYDELMALQPPEKTKDLCCIMTYQPTYDQSMMRVNFMHEVVKKYDKFDLFGRPEVNFKADKLFEKVYGGCVGNNTYDAYKGEHIVGKERVINYRHSLEFDQGPTTNYFSERFYDSMLLWCMPIYWGSSNVHDFIPENSFRYIDILNLNESEVDKVINIVNSDFREKNIEAMKEARYLMLNKLQTWAYVCDIVNSF